MLANANFEYYKRVWLLYYRRVGLLVDGIAALLLFAYVIGSMVALPYYGILPLVLILGLCGAFLIFRWPLVGFALIFFFVPLGPITHLIGSGRTASVGVAALLLGIFGTRVLIFHEKIKLDYVSKLAFTFALWGMITCIWAYDPHESFTWLPRLVQLIAVNVLILNYCRSKRDLDILTLSFAAGAVVAAMGAILTGTTYLNMRDENARVSLSEDFNPNMLSAVLSLGLVLMFYHFYKTKYKLLRFFLALGIVPVGYAIIQAQSRTAWVALPVSLFISTVLTTRNLKVIRKVIVAVVILFGLISSAYYSGIINEVIIERYRTLFTEDTITATSGRNEIWKVGLEIVKDSPILGVGFKNFEIAYPNYVRAANISHEWFLITRKGTDAHNTFLAIFAETGLVGFILFVGILIHLFKGIWRTADPVERLTQMWLLFSLILLSSGGTYHLFPWFWLALSFFALAANLERETNQRGFSA